MPDDPELSRQVAKSLLALKFGPEDQERMQLLSAKARDGSLSQDEEQEIDSYERAGHLLGILQSKARRALRGTNGSDAQ